MTFVETLLSEGFVFDDENFDSCYIKQDEEGNTHCYQEGEDEGEWCYVKLSPLFSVLEEYMVTV